MAINPETGFEIEDPPNNPGNGEHNPLHRQVGGVVPEPFEQIPAGEEESANPSENPFGHESFVQSTDTGFQIAQNKESGAGESYGCNDGDHALTEEEQRKKDRAAAVIAATQAAAIARLANEIAQIEQQQAQLFGEIKEIQKDISSFMDTLSPEDRQIIADVETMKLDYASAFYEGKNHIAYADENGEYYVIKDYETGEKIYVDTDEFGTKEERTAALKGIRTEIKGGQKTGDQDPVEARRVEENLDKLINEKPELREKYHEARTAEGTKDQYKIFSGAIGLEDQKMEKQNQIKELKSQTSSNTQIANTESVQNPTLEMDETHLKNSQKVAPQIEGGAITRANLTEAMGPEATSEDMHKMELALDRQGIEITVPEGEYASFADSPEFNLTNATHTEGVAYAGWEDPAANDDSNDPNNSSEPKPEQLAQLVARSDIQSPAPGIQLDGPKPNNAPPA